MPPHKTTKKMDAKVAALESEVAHLHTTHVQMQEKAETNQARLLELLGKQAQEKEDSGSIRNNTIPVRSGKESGGPSYVYGWTKLDAGLLDEFRKSAKKVELPLFNGEDLAGWIARAEVYFHVNGYKSRGQGESGTSMYGGIHNPLLQQLTALGS
ncbi:hypothetical protein OROGR_016139 [Orobanche gracilis]